MTVQIDNQMIKVSLALSTQPKIYKSGHGILHSQKYIYLKMQMLDAYMFMLKMDNTVISWLLCPLH